MRDVHWGHSIRATRLCALGVFVFVAVLGCGKAPDTRPTRHPTKGTLTYNGKPLKGAVVVFWPLPLEKNDWQTTKPQALVEADGSYQPNCFDQKDGAMAGEYVVTVQYTGETAGPGPDLLKGRHSDPKKPVLKVTIREGENTIPPIEIKGPPLNAKDPTGAGGG